VSTVIAAAALLILVPAAFNAAFFALGRAFDYPNILRKEPDEILRRFAAGGSRLIWRWQALLWSSLAMVPLVAMLAAVLAAPLELTLLTVALGVSAGLAQALGLVRWPFAVPELARRYVAAPEGATGDTTRATVEVVFAAMQRLSGVGTGEHLGYMLTGAWTLSVGASIMSTAVLPAWSGIVAIPIGASLVFGSFEFSGAHERDGWSLAGAVVPLAYIAWSLWLIALGLLLLV
jgi:hypothetical protein